MELHQFKIEYLSSLQVSIVHMVHFIFFLVVMTGLSCIQSSPQRQTITSNTCMHTNITITCDVTTTAVPNPWIKLIPINCHKKKNMKKKSSFNCHFLKDKQKIEKQGNETLMCRRINIFHTCALCNVCKKCGLYKPHQSLDSQPQRTTASLNTQLKMKRGFSLKGLSLTLVIVFLIWFSSFDSCNARRGKHWRQNRAASSSLSKKKAKNNGGHGSKSHGGSKSPSPAPAPPKKGHTDSDSTVFNVIDFGAKGDGATDDTKVIPRFYNIFHTFFFLGVNAMISFLVIFATIVKKTQE